MNDSSKIILSGKSQEELKILAKALNMPVFVGKQLSDWLYKKDICSFSEMSNISSVNRHILESQCELGFRQSVAVQESKDGTKKYLFPTSQNLFIESAYIPDKDRATLCVSSQVGCRMGCLFCATGKQSFKQHLSAGEIINQIRSLPERHMLTNIVYMGMGEPFDNTDEVIKSIEILTAEWGFAMSPRRITVSTVGIISGIQKFMDATEAHLAISLHSPFDEERQSIMPVEKAFAIAQVIRLLKTYDWSHQRRLSFEYIMFKHFNDTDRHLSALTNLLSGLPCRVNLIRFHAAGDPNFQTSTEERMVYFRDKLSQRGIITTIRQSRGEDIDAACGLLSTKASF